MLKQNKTTCSIVSLIACLGMLGTNALASSVTPTSNIKAMEVAQKSASKIEAFKLQPRFNVWGFTGDKTLAETQVLFPLKGDNNKVLYAIGEGNYTKNDSSWMAGLGFGYRQIVDGKILGGYLIADYVSTPQNGFVVANPGIEVLGFHDVWDFNVNGYIPLEKEKKLGKEGWAGDDFGDYSFGRATGHEFYDHKMQEFEEAGAGFDVEVGRTIPGFEKAKVYLGGYHFDSRESGSINGIETRFTYDLNKYTALELENNYDNLHKNKFIVGVRFGLGGYSQEEKQQFGLATRLLDPIEHDHVVATHRASISEAFVDKGEQREHDNIWYFKSGNAVGGVQTGSGTAEDPLVNFTQANYDVVYAHKDTGILDPHPLMYFAPGQYSFADFTTEREGTQYEDRFALENGWGMYGRSSDYKARANGDERARFDGGLDMVYSEGAGTDATILDSVRIYNNVGGINSPEGQNNATLYIKNADNVIFNNVHIKNDVTSALLALYVDGIYADSSTLNFNGGTSTIDSKAKTSSDTAIAYSYGIFSEISILNFNAGINSVNSSTETSLTTDYPWSYGISAYSSILNFNGGTNVLNTDSIHISYGIYLNDSSTLNFNGGINTVNTISSGYAYGLFADNQSTLNFNGGTNTIDSSSPENTSSFRSYGIYLYPLSTLNFNGGTNYINSSADVSTTTAVTAYACGIYADSATLYFNGGTNYINASASGVNAGTGIYIYGIYSSTSTLNFKNSTPINITITKSETGNVLATTGIYVGAGAGSLKYWDSNTNQFTAFTLDTIPNIADYVTFTKTAGSGSGAPSDKKVDWTSIYLDW